MARAADPRAMGLAHVIARCAAPLLAVLFACITLGCSAHQGESGGEPMRMVLAGEKSRLAYEHDAELQLPASDIPARLRSVREACVASRFGACTVLTVRERGGDHPGATLRMRMAPKAVEPLVAMAGQGAQLGARSTRAEDLADVVRDNDMAQDRLRRERDQLQTFQSRGDLSVADMIALSRQLADTESKLQAAREQGARHRQRIETQLLTLEFMPPGGESGLGEIGMAVRDFGGMLATGTAWTIRAFAFLIPLVLLLAAILYAMRWRRQRVRQAGQP